MRSLLACALALVCVLAQVQSAAAGGNEFPADGARNLGRGATGFTRADDPHLMLRNPALLADMWDDVAMGGAHFLLTKSCFQATGAYGWNYPPGADISDFGDGPIYLQDPDNGYFDEPYPEVCSEGPMPILPSLALTKKLSPSVGVGIGFFPPDTAALNQWGNPDGTVDTANGLRPSPTRFFKSLLATSYLSALAAVGYRPTDWLRVGFGFQWTAVAFDTRTWSRASPTLSPRTDITTKTNGQDLFIPGFIASAQIVPTDSLDFAVGFKWSDRVKSDASLDLTSGAFGATNVFVGPDGKPRGTTIPTTSYDQPGTVNAPPIWVPQLTFGARYSDRIMPRVTTADWKKRQWAANGHVDDSMSMERWDIEAEAVVYFNSVTDKTVFDNDAKNGSYIKLQDVGPDGTIAPGISHIGKCTKGDVANCTGQWRTTTVLAGRDQLSLRLGGDYNIFPGIFSVRAGVSHETTGVAPEYLDITTYMLGRTGFHAGFTLRVAGKTDISFAFAHFIQPEIRLQVNDLSKFPSRYYKDAQGNTDPVLAKKFHYTPGKLDGTAKYEVPYGNEFGPNFANAGTYYYNLDVISFSLAQHF